MKSHKKESTQTEVRKTILNMIKEKHPNASDAELLEILAEKLAEFEAEERRRKMS